MQFYSDAVMQYWSDGDRNMNFRFANCYLPTANIGDWDFEF
jgi:hypothetical protein